ncbi:unnamed protein product, partial [Closterium sp. Naga37s-1]
SNRVKEEVYEEDYMRSRPSTPMSSPPTALTALLAPPLRPWALTLRSPFRGSRGGRYRHEGGAGRYEGDMFDHRRGRGRGGEGEIYERRKGEEGPKGLERFDGGGGGGFMGPGGGTGMFEERGPVMEGPPPLSCSWAAQEGLWTGRPCLTCLTDRRPRCRPLGRPCRRTWEEACRGA